MEDEFILLNKIVIKLILLLVWATTILAVDSTNARSDITTSGTYTGTTSAIYRIEIDYQNVAGSIFTFKWSNDAGKTYQGTHKKVEASSQPLLHRLQ